MNHLCLISPSISIQGTAMTARQKGKEKQQIQCNGMSIGPLVKGQWSNAGTHGLAGSANSDFTFVIASQGEMADALGFSVEWAELPHEAHSILWWCWLTGVWPLIADPANPCWYSTVLLWCLSRISAVHETYKLLKWTCRCLIRSRAWTTGIWIHWPWLAVPREPWCAQTEQPCTLGGRNDHRWTSCRCCLQIAAYHWFGRTLQSRSCTLETVEDRCIGCCQPCLLGAGCAPCGKSWNRMGRMVFHCSAGSRRTLCQSRSSGTSHLMLENTIICQDWAVYL